MLKEVRGGASRLNLAADISAMSAAINVSGASLANWPTGVVGPFVIRIDDELILCSSRATTAITVAQRGWNSTAAAAHAASTASVRHVIDADTIADLLAHVYDDSRDDHSQYIKTDGSRPFTNVSAMTAAPQPIGTALDQGDDNTFARSDHIHTIPTNGISALMLPDNVIAQRHLDDDVVGRAEIKDGDLYPEHFSAKAVGNAALGDNAADARVIGDASVDTAALQDTSLTLPKFAANVRPIVICTSTTRPGAPAVGQLVFETDTLLYSFWNGTIWTPANTPVRLAYAVSNALDLTQGSNPSWRQLSFTLASQRLIKVEAFAEYQQITATGNSSEYVQLGLDGGRNVRVLMDINTPLNVFVPGSAALWQVCPAGAHTAEMFVANNSTVGAMRFVAGQGGAWISVSDWGPA